MLVEQEQTYEEIGAVKASLSRKQPRDFVHLDEFWPADDSLPHHYIHHHVWVYMDEYRAELAGDQAYCRIIVNIGQDCGWIYQLPLEHKEKVIEVSAKIHKPVSEMQLENLGFSRWSGEPIY